MAFSMWDHLTKQRAWSRETFGPNFRPKGIIDHVRKECDEVLKEPTDLEEWIDLAFLAFDGALHIATPQQVIDGLQAKLRKNEARDWPDWRTMDPDKAIEHDRSGESFPMIRVCDDCAGDPAYCADPTGWHEVYDLPDTDNESVDER